MRATAGTLRGHHEWRPLTGIRRRRAGEAPASSLRQVRPTHQGFRPDVEGLRAVAILLVVLYHTNTGITGGYVGVDVFFVISGFLITGQLAKELAMKGRVSFLGFYARRARRILPAATLVTIVTVIASGLLLNPIEAQRVFGDATAAIFFGANFHFAAQGADYFNASLPPSPVQHYWSLSVEEQFYVMWPLLLVVSSLVWLGVRRRRANTGQSGSRPSQGAESVGTRGPNMRVVVLVLGAVAAASFFASIQQTAHSPSWAYYSILTRAWELAIGALIALSVSLTARLDRHIAALATWVGVACIVVAALMFDDETAYPGDSALLPVAGAAVIIAAGGAASKRWGAEALLGTAPFQRVGSWSYSWYLWHWPVLILGAAALGHSLSEPEALSMAALSLLFAVLSFVIVERPIRRMQLVVRRPALGLAGGGALAACSITVVVLCTSLFALPGSRATATPPALTASHQLTPAQLSRDLAAGVNTRKVPSNLDPPLAKAENAKPIIVNNGCHLQFVEVRSKPCVYGDTKSPTSIVLFGDSHAAAWFPALDLLSHRQHWRLVDLTKAGCPPAQVNILRRGQPYPECRQWRRNAKAQIAALHPGLVIMTWARYIEQPEARPLAGVPAGYGSTWQNGLAAIFSFLRQSATHVVFISDVPTLSELAPECVSGHMSDVRACTTKRRAATVLPDIKNQEISLARRAGITTIDPTSWFCAATRCPVIVGNIFLYRDNAHMVPAWSRFIAPVLSDTIVPLIHPTNGKTPS